MNYVHILKNCDLFTHYLILADFPTRECEKFIFSYLVV